MHNKTSSLAKGLDAILHSRKENTNKNISNRIDKVHYLSTKNIIPSTYQPRTVFDEGKLEELVASIKSQGILQPIVVRLNNCDQYEIIAGERRWRAAVIACEEFIPAVIQQVDSKTAISIALIENLQREDLNAIDKAISINRLINEFQLTHEKVAEILGCSRPMISNILRLLGLCDEVKELLKNSKIEMGHARPLLTLNEKMQIEIASKIIQQKLSVRQTEKLVNRYKNKTEKVNTGSFVDKHQLMKWKKSLAEKVQAKVNIKIDSEGGGQVVINLSSLKDIEWFVENVNCSSKV